MLDVVGKRHDWLVVNFMIISMFVTNILWVYYGKAVAFSGNGAGRGYVYCFADYIPCLTLHVCHFAVTIDLGRGF